MKLIKSVLGALVLGSALLATCHATTFNYRDGEGTLKLYLSFETGLPVVVINTVNPNNLATCDFEAEQCIVTEDNKIVCDAGEGEDPLIVELRTKRRLKVTSFPESFCGMGASALGSYKLAK